MRLYVVTGCPFAHRAAIALREKRLDFEIAFFEVEEPPPELAALGPRACSPTLIDGGAAISDSWAILQFIEERHPEPRLMPATTDGRAQVRSAIAWFDERILPSMHAFICEVFFRHGRDQVRVAATADRIRERLRLLDAALAHRMFIAGDEFTLADIVLYTLFPSLKLLGDFDVPPHLVHLCGWLDRIGSRPSAPLPTPDGGPPVIRRPSR